VKRKVILDLCGGTGAWSEPYRKAGYTVHVITLPKYDVTKVDPSGNWIYFIQQDIRWEDSLLIDCREIFGILAAPPCTEFSLAKGATPRDFEAGMEIVSACLKIIWHCRINAKLKFWCMENPVGFLRQFLGKPAFTFEQWQFGDDGIKPTDLWGYFKKPKFSVKEKPCGLTKRFPSGRTTGRGWSIPVVPEEYRGLGLGRAALRAITPPGFAQAFFNANKQKVVYEK